MIRNKKTLQTTGSAGEYLAPNVEVMEIKVREMLCGSPNETYDDGGSLNDNF